MASADVEFGNSNEVRGLLVPEDIQQIPTRVAPWKKALAVVIGSGVLLALVLIVPRLSHGEDSLQSDDIHGGGLQQLEDDDDDDGAAAAAQAAQAAAAARAAAAAAAWARHNAFLHAKWATAGVNKWLDEHDCPAQMNGWDVKTEVDLKTVWNVRTAADCQKLCTEDADCDAFAWGYARNKWGVTDNCFIKQLGENETRLNFTKKDGIMAGVPCNRSKEKDVWWPANIQDRFDLPDPGPENIRGLDVASMLCLVLMMPYSYEQGLLEMQWKEGYGIFGCDRWRIYSSQKINLFEDVTTRKIKSTQMCEKGGASSTALNTEIFMAFWRAVIEDAEYKQVSWTVKVDPDSVFFPYRLAPLLYKRLNDLNGTGVYLNNCWHGLHGPIEVLSQNAIRTLGQKAMHCYWAMTGMCHGPGDCNWGEDKWLDQCFQIFAGVKRRDEWAQLVEDHCDPWPGWRSCQAPERVAFHPFKDLWDWKACYERGYKVNNASQVADKLPHHRVLVNISTLTTPPPTTSTTTTTTTMAAES
mmetsp:Transcript_87943/g.155939  ORF Transcript_87943/g.155939 Transcript_87943/m.155939 type:complete len:526 (-) Transcript_87943:77-1654(-)